LDFSLDVLGGTQRTDVDYGVPLCRCRLIAGVSDWLQPSFRYGVHEPSAVEPYGLTLTDFSGALSGGSQGLSDRRFYDVDESFLREIFVSYHVLIIFVYTSFQGQIYILFTYLQTFFKLFSNFIYMGTKPWTVGEKEKGLRDGQK
jgi:hypothetical protein